MWIEYNPNPYGNRTDDCAVRAIAKALNMSWEEAFMILAIHAFEVGKMPSTNSVWGDVLRQNGFKRESVPDACVDCYTAEDFCNEFFRGTYVLGFGNHVAVCQNGNLFDAWDSSQESPQYFWYKEV